jgi:hypothetical protein
MRAGLGASTSEQRKSFDCRSLFEELGDRLVDSLARENVDLE